ncbi:MAG TPA: GGDEF domain-containing protein [Steroidobacter sp.]|uniref:GGDEF domain-containing protein n=1 Tax=Steroidobacter sp. TaxID=1978227 RepID=UPI002ED950CA
MDEDNDGGSVLKEPMFRDFRKISPRMFWLVTLASLVVLLVVVAVPQLLSKNARMQVLRSHVAEIAQIAASVVDGDLHRQLLDPANYTPELYERTVAPLVRFHSAAPEIFYVYTMMERGGKSVFVVDTAASSDLKTSRKLRPSAYMEPFETIDVDPDPDYLQRIAAGETYVYPKFQRDVYGTFLSGHTPIYDSQGRYSGFVGVDFDIKYYLDQESSFHAIFYGSMVGAVLIALLIGYLVARYHYHVQDRIEEQYRISIRDELTQLLNRRGALRFSREALEARASSYAVILVDIDDLKGINDIYGHAAGDEFIVKVADTIRHSVREKDICARMGGDEFLIFATGCDLDAATEIARRILGKVFAQDDHAGRSHFGVSIGICVAPGAEANFEMLYRQADEALYKAKSAGRNRFVIFDPVIAATG